MVNKKALFVGCSFTANSGFTIENQSKYHWPHLFCQATGFDITNRAISGMSNNEIFFRTVDAITASDYDLVVVMWSEVSRLWEYCSDANNVDDFTMLNNGVPRGFRADTDYVREYAKIHYQWFDNRYIKIKHWLLQCWSLEQTLKNRKIPFVFVKGFDNGVNTICNVTYDKGFINIGPLKKMLDFDNKPDKDIQLKLDVLKKLIQNQDQAHWLNLIGLSFYDMSIDRSDDDLHPGPKTNQILADRLITFYKGLNEQSI